MRASLPHRRPFFSMSSRSLFRAFALVACLAPGAGALAMPYRPDDDAQVLERLPAGLPRAQASTAADSASAARIARAYIERSRQEADPRFLGYAEGVLQPWWNDPEPPPELLLLRATIHQSRHRFDDALDDLARLLRRQPRHAQALLTRATILRVQGRYAAAVADCRALRGLADAFVASLCEHSVRGLHGELPEAAAALDALAATARDQSAAVRTWYSAERADLARRQDQPDGALQLYRLAIAQRIDDPLLVAAAADLLLDQGRAAEALALVGAAPQADLLKLRRVRAARALGQPQAGIEAALADAYAAARRRGDQAHLREEARFVLAIRNDPVRALRLAQDNWRAQREPEDARLLLEAALAAGQPAAAFPVRVWLRDSRLQDADLEELLSKLAGQ